MLTPGSGETDGAAEPELASLGVAPYAAAGRGGQELQPPTAAEHRGAGAEQGADEIDLTDDLRPALVDMERRAGNGDAVITLKAHAVGEVGAGVSRVGDIHDRARQELAQQVGIAFARDGAAGRLVARAPCCGIAFNDEEARSGHRVFRAGLKRYRSHAFHSLTGAEFQPANAIGHGPARFNLFESQRFRGSFVAAAGLTKPRGRAFA